MEKSTEKRRKFFIGLLILLFATCADIYAVLPWAYIQTLKFRPAQEYFFTLSDCQFALDIENVPPERVTVFSNNVPRYASFVSARKETYIPEDYKTNTRTGTHVIVSFRFEKPGTYQISPLDVRIDGQYCSIPLDVVNVYENPNIIQPEVFIKFDKGIAPVGNNLTVNIGDHIGFTVYIKYAVQIINFSWNVPEDSLFNDVRRYEIMEGVPRGSDFSPDAVPVAKFDWQPLVKGNYSFPRMTILATSYSGIRYNVKFDSYNVTVLDGQNFRYSDSKFGSEFDYAFSVPVLDESAKESVPVEKDYEVLYQLHVRERHSVPFISDASKIRWEVEMAAGLSPLQREPSVPLFIILVGLSVLLFIASVLFFVFRHIHVGGLTTFFFVLTITLTIVQGLEIKVDYALFTGHEVRTIPEETGDTSVKIPDGSLVRIEHNLENWVFVRYNDTYGWVKKDTLRIVE